MLEFCRQNLAGVTYDFVAKIQTYHSENEHCMYYKTKEKDMK